VGRFSVLIGRSSTADERRIFETLESLRRQQDAPAYEVIVADRCGDAVTREIEARYPEVRLLRLPPRTPLPELRAAALDVAAGSHVVVIEDHCIASADWLRAIASAFEEAPAGTVAIGGCVENGVRDSALDHATFLCEYSAFTPPVAEGPTASLPGMNIAYERRALAAVDRALFREGFWETTVHPVLVAAGGAFRSTGRIRLVHSKKFRARFFVRQRYVYSRHYAARRFQAGRRGARALAFALTPLLPALLLARITANARAAGRVRSELLPALPWLALFAIVWAWGEMVGYAAGPGDSLSEIE
jgi:glycosyltransferase involved in cell wall biosynthesis